MIKKNITINFCGSLYNIDEDAYELLLHYTESIRRYFSKQTGTEDVADDIESRIAELFDELMANGANAINKEMTEEVIKRIGNLEDIAPEGDKKGESNDGETATETIRATIRHSWETMKSSKRYYRDMGNKIICGVFAGCAQFFGGSPLAWRICFLVILGVIWAICNIFHTSFASVVLITFLGYFAMAIMAPKAVAPEEVLQMKGKGVTPQNIAEEISLQQTKRGSIFAEIMGGIGRIILVIFSLSVVFLLIMSLGALGVFVCQPMDTIFEYTHNCAEDQELYYVIRTPLFFCIGAVIAILSILTYCCFHAVSSSLGKTPSMGFRQRLIWLVAFISSVAILVGGIFICAPKINHYNRMHTYHISSHSHQMDGANDKKTISYSLEDWRYYHGIDTKVIKAENITDLRFTHQGDYYTGDSTVRYMDAYSANKDLIFHVKKRKVYLRSGSYQISCICRAAKGAHGAYVYAQVLDRAGNELNRYMEAIVADGDEGNRLAKVGEKYGMPANLSGKVDTSLNNGKGRGWSYITIDNIVVPSDGATIAYGITTDPEFTGKESEVEWVSACDFDFKRMDNSAEVKNGSKE